jgi:hypothetical protein
MSQRFKLRLVGSEMVSQYRRLASITCLRSSESSAGDQCRRTARIVSQDVLVKKGLRAMRSRLRRSQSKPLGVHWELLMQVPRVADDSQHLVDWCHSCSRECARLPPERLHIADKDCSHASPTD